MNPSWDGGVLEKFILLQEEISKNNQKGLNGKDRIQKTLYD